MRSRVVRLVLAVAGTLVAVVFAEAWLASRAQHIEPYDRAELDGVVGDEPGTPIRLAWVGDSTGVGVGASSPDRVLSRMVAEGLGCRVDLSVLAVSGARARNVLVSQVPSLAALRPEWVVVAIGNNDVTHATSRGRFAAQLDEILDGVAAAGASRVIVLGTAEFSSTPLFAQPLRAIAGARSDRLDREVRAAASRHNAVYVDIIGRTGPAFVADPVRYHAHDRFHPSDDGYALWARAVLDTVREAGADC
jgi:lysophospholipase L1-like esterase